MRYATNITARQINLGGFIFSARLIVNRSIQTHTHVISFLNENDSPAVIKPFDHSEYSERAVVIWSTVSLFLCYWDKSSPNISHRKFPLLSWQHTFTVLIEVEQMPERLSGRDAIFFFCIIKKEQKPKPRKLKCYYSRRLINKDPFTLWKKKFFFLFMELICPCSPC